MNFWVESTKGWYNLFNVVYNVFQSWFCFFDWCSYRIMSSSIGLETRAIAAGIKKYKSITKKKKKHGKIGYSAKPKLNQI